MSRYVPSNTELVYWLAVESAVAAEALLKHLGVKRRTAREIVSEARCQDFTANGLELVHDELVKNGIAP